MSGRRARRLQWRHADIPGRPDPDPGQIRFGLSSTITQVAPVSGGPAPTLAVDEPGFNNVAFNSTGDVQFLPVESSTGSGTTSNGVDIISAGDLSFTAAQLDPTTQASAIIVAGINPTGAGNSSIYFPAGQLTISGNGTDPAAPLSAGGSLVLGAATIIQGGIIRAPLGTIQLGGVSLPGTDAAQVGGGNRPNATSTVELLRVASPRSAPPARPFRLAARRTASRSWSPTALRTPPPTLSSTGRPVPEPSPSTRSRSGWQQRAPGSVRGRRTGR